MSNTTNEEHVDTTEELSLDTIKARAVRGIVLLTGRTLVLNVISTISNFLLWLFIDPKEFGVFLLVTATVNFLSYFADIGLGAALIQKKEKPVDEDYKTVFVVQEALVLTVVAIVFLISPYIARTHSFRQEDLYLLYALNISFLMASLKNIPSIILERKLEYAKFVIPQVLENLVYSVSIVFFAWKGYGISTFTYAVLLRGVIGLITIYILQPWKPGFAFSMKSFKHLIRYGIPYQFNSFLATIKDDGMTIALGGILGTARLGNLGVAQKLSQYPLRFFMDNVNKVTFPAFSRMQDDRKDLARSLTRSIFFICALVFPSLVGLVILFPVLITVIPKYQKWSPAYIPLLFLSVNSMWAASTTQLTNLMASIGKIKSVLKLMVMWTVLTWLLVPYMARTWGLNGAAAAYGIIGFSSIVAFMMVKKTIDWSIKESVVVPFIASAVMGVSLLLLRDRLDYNVLNFLILVTAGSIVYMASLYFLIGSSIVGDVKKVFSELVKKRG